MCITVMYLLYAIRVCVGGVCVCVFEKGGRESEREERDSNISQSIAIFQLKLYNSLN